MSYISISLYRKVIQHAIHEGMSPADFSNLPTPMESIDSLQAVPSDHFFALHELIDERIGPGFSVRVGQQMKMEDYGVLGLSWRTCAWAGEIFDRSERYFKLLSDTYVFQVEQGADTSHIYLHRDAYRKGVALSNEATLAATVVVLQAMTETDIAPIAVAFQHDAPAQLDSHHTAFQCDLAFNQSHNAITYHTQDLALRTAKADASINRFLVERVEEETKGLEVSAHRVSNDVEQLIKDALPSGIPSIHQISEHMGMSNRTLTRRLSENGLTFRDLIKKTQEELSKDLLKNSSRSASEIAFQTGFSEQSAFNRAFKRWTDQSPLDYRKNH
ncbi:MAG: AraC family transcriptional regulator ligand-binding domain-containing protein [Cyclobacteriaceae bacterium]